MFRAVAGLVAAAMLTLSGSVALRHVHDESDHEHDDHHHGPSVHWHAAPAHAPHDVGPSGPEGAPLVAGCSPRDHIVSLSYEYFSAEPEEAGTPGHHGPGTACPSVTSARGISTADVRVHGPPRITDGPLRAPPLVHPA